MCFHKRSLVNDFRAWAIFREFPLAKTYFRILVKGNRQSKGLLTCGFVQIVW